MKTCTITLQCTDNAGSSLQTYALQKFLLDNNIDNEVINYRPKYLIKYGNPIKRLIKEIIYYKDCRSQKIKNLKFEKKYIVETKNEYKTYKQLMENPPIADIYITGSDQIWNMSYACGNDDAFYLKFAKKGKKIAYAASIGKDIIPSDECNKICEYIDSFDYISVREESSKIQLMNFTDKEISCVCDPVLLLDAKQYRKMETKCLDEKFILVYLVKPSKLLDDLVAYIKEIYKCKVVLIFGVKDNCQCDIHKRDLSPDEFLWYIDNAEFIIASSFHAMMFSHIFQKNFAIVLPEANQARIKHFLGLSGLEQRIIKEEADIKRLVQGIDYSNVVPRIKCFSDYSQKYILHAISDCYKEAD